MKVNVLEMDLLVIMTLADSRWFEISSGRQERDFSIASPISRISDAETIPR